MRFDVRKASDWTYLSEVTINTVPQLIKFMQERGYCLVIQDSLGIDDEDVPTENYIGGNSHQITIYDHYME